MRCDVARDTPAERNIREFSYGNLGHSGNSFTEAADVLQVMPG